MCELRFVTSMGEGATQDATQNTTNPRIGYRRLVTSLG
jgi:hypothetical protein